MRTSSKSIFCSLIICLIILSTSCKSVSDGLYAYNGPSPSDTSSQWGSYMYLSSEKNEIKIDEAIELAFFWGTHVDSLQKIEISVQTDVFSYTIDCSEIIDFTQEVNKIEEYIVPFSSIDSASIDKMPFIFHVELVANGSATEGQQGQIEIAVTEYAVGGQCKRYIMLMYSINKSTISFSVQ